MADDVPVVRAEPLERDVLGPARAAPRVLLRARAAGRPRRAAGARPVEAVAARGTERGAEAPAWLKAGHHGRRHLYYDDRYELPE